MGDVFCVAQSSRAEYTYIEAEWPFIDFPKLLEDLVTDVVYLTLPKGSLTNDHVLICPIGHHSISNQISLPEEAVQEVNKFKSALRKMYKKHGKSVVFFERNYKQTHLQIQVCVLLFICFSLLYHTFTCFPGCTRA